MFPACWLNLSSLYQPYWECSPQAELSSSETQSWFILTLTGCKCDISKLHAKQEHHRLTNSIFWTCCRKRKLFLQSSMLPLQCVSLKLLILFQVICKSRNHPGFGIADASVKCCAHHILLWHFKQVILVYFTPGLNLLVEWKQPRNASRMECLV